MLTELSALREAVGKTQAVSVNWLLLAGKFRQFAGRNVRK